MTVPSPQNALWAQLNWALIHVHLLRHSQRSNQDLKPSWMLILSMDREKLKQDLAEVISILIEGRSGSVEGCSGSVG